MSPWVEPSHKRTRTTTWNSLFILMYELGFKNSRAIFNPYLIIWPDTNSSFYVEMKSYVPVKFSQGIITTKGRLVPEACSERSRAYGPEG